MSRTTLLQPSTLGFVARDSMPHHLSILFRARPPLEQGTPIPKGKCKPLRGLLDEHRDYFARFEDCEPPKQIQIEKASEKKDRLKKEKVVKHLVQQNEEIKKCNIVSSGHLSDFIIEATVKAKSHVARKYLINLFVGNPNNDPNIKSDPNRTLFVCKLSRQTDEKKLRKEFIVFGPIRRIRVVVDEKTGIPKGYAFIEYENKRDLEQALMKGDGRRVDGRRVCVDYERGRIKQEWLPRRLGGGRGDTRRNRVEEKLIRELKRTHPLLREKSRSREKSLERHQSQKAQQVKEEEVKVKIETRRSEERVGEKHRSNENPSSQGVKKEEQERRSYNRSDSKERSEKKEKKDKKKKDKKEKKDKDKKKKDKKEKKEKKDKKKRSSEKYGKSGSYKETGAQSQGNGENYDRESEEGEIQE